MDLSNILDQSTQLAQLCSSPILVSVDELKKLVDKIKEVKVSSQDPPKTIQTTRLLLLPPPSPPKLVTQALQEPSVASGVDTGISVQTMSTPPTTEREQDKQEEEKEETHDKEESTIQTLVEFPKIGTPTKPLQ